MQLSIKYRLALLVAVSTITCALVAAMSWKQMRDEMAYAKELNEQRLKPVWLLESLTRSYSHGVVDTAHKLRSQMLFWGEGAKALEAARSQIESDWKNYRNHKLADQEKVLLAEIQPGIEQSMQAIETIAGHIKEKSNYALGNYIDLKMYAELEPVFTAIDQLMAQQTELAKAEQQAADRRLASTTQRTIISVAVLTAILFGLSLWLARSILKPLDSMRITVGQIINDLDFSARVEVKGRDELGELAQAFNRLIEMFTRTLQELNQITIELSQAADTLVSTAGNTQSQVKKQNRELDQVNQSIESVAGAAKGVLSSVEQTSAATNNSNTSAEQGQAIVGQTIGSINQLAEQVNRSAKDMQELNQSSESIGGVLGVISDIAEQTNLLALNAAIEAARAGEQGRGFAVVADEVRQLAQRTAKSTMEIRNMIESIQTGTQQVSASMTQGVEAARCSVESAEETGAAIGVILDTIASINEHSGNISQSASEQINYSQQLSKRSDSLLGICKETAQLAEASADCSQSVAATSKQLRQLLNKYTI